MKAARTYADELLARFNEPAQVRIAGVPPANSAKAAKDEHACGLAGDSALCEGLRIAANPPATCRASGADSQTFAALRNRTNDPESEQRRGFSQDSQVSQEVGADCALSVATWADADIARFTARVHRLLRWGWPESEAEALAERLTQRERNGADDRVSCAGECAHYRPGRCRNHRPAGLQSADVGRDLAGLLQRCPGFATTKDHEPRHQALPRRGQGRA